MLDCRFREAKCRSNLTRRKSIDVKEDYPLLLVCEPVNQLIQPFYQLVPAFFGQIAIGFIVEGGEHG